MYLVLCCVGGLIRENWLAVFDSLRTNVSVPDLMWNDETYAELMVALRTELVEFQRQQVWLAVVFVREVIKLMPLLSTCGHCV